MTVVVQDGRIAGIDKSADKNVTVPRGAEVVDGRNKFLIPGLWDMHVHLSYARPSALPALVANGVTGVRDIGSDLAEIDRWRTQIEENARLGPVIVRAGPMLNGMEFNRYQLLVADAAEARAAVRTLQKVGVDFIKFHRRTSREAFFGIAETARTLKLPFTGHVPMTVTPAEASRWPVDHRTYRDAVQRHLHGRARRQTSRRRSRSGERPTRARSRPVRQERHLRGSHPHRAGIPDALLETNQADANTAYIAASARKERDKTLAGIRPAAAKLLRERKPFISELRAVTAVMSREGVPLLAGTDTSFLHPPGFTLHDELQALVDSGVSTADVLRAATVNPARLFPRLETGYIAPDKRADLELLDANPLVDIRNTRRINAVVARGRLLNRASLDRLLREAVAQANQE